MARITPVLWKGKNNARGEHPIYLRLEADNRRQYFSLRIYVRPSHWNPKSHSVRKGHKHADALNRLICLHVDKADAEVLRLRNASEAITPAAIKEALTARTTSCTDFLEYGRVYAEELRQRGKIPTHRRYVSILRKLDNYAGGRLPFEKLTFPFLRAYRGHLVEKYGNSESTLASNFRAIKSLVNRAIKDGILPADKSPFLNFPVVEPRSTKAKLSLDEIDAIRGLDLPTGSALWHTRNYFLFSFYCAGIRFRDVCLLLVENVNGGRLTYTMRKTNTPKDIGLVPAAQAILENYDVDDRPPKALLFPLLEGYDRSTAEKLDRSVQSKNALVNSHLKEIASRSGLKGNLSFHMSRHSWADFARRKGWDVYKISKALGHKDLKVTENYLKGFDTESIDDAMGELFR